jgi:hypothetical protein
VNAEVDYGASFKTVPGYTKGVIRFEPDASSNVIDQAKVTSFQYVDIKGNVPSLMIETKRALMSGAIKDMRDEFAQDVLIDDSERAEVEAVITEAEEESSASGASTSLLMRTKRKKAQEAAQEESEIIDRVEVIFDIDDTEFTELESPDPFVSLKLYVRAKRRCATEGRIFLSPEVLSA